MKKSLAIACMLLGMLVSGQKSILLQNINVRANELKHGLNKSGDSLILEGKRIINKVEIFNNNFEKTFIVENHNAKIPLNNIPIGRFVTEVKVDDKLIIITLLRNESFEKLPEVSTEKEYAQNKNALASQNEASGTTLSISNSEGKLNKQLIKSVRFYWIVYKINKGHSSSKIMKIGDRKSVTKMIRQNKIDLKTKSGKYNELTIWEVYDTSKFMRYKRQNPDYANAKEVDCFNTVPFFQSQTED
ncbi:hypothetical protein [uncultured Winogradskyella sp.]|uniref:hypothetical protein n=1 Tax=uncultured Winogradskyella sp. TaxID=395353 RepID=UPI0030DC9E57|tara:strand:- start:15409 stop:16143 length:735 start_codon:yes stop_codon:yes gene_type:complete